MQKTMKSVLAVLIATLMLFSVTACGTNGDTDETKATEVATAETLNETVAETQVQTETEVEDKTEDTANEQIDNSSDELVTPAVSGVWKHENYPEGCSIKIESQDGNTLTFTINAVRGQGAQIASCTKTVTLTPEDHDNEVRGYAEFDYTDSFDNSGVGNILVGENVITLVVEQQVDGGGGWSLGHASGDYLFAG